MNKLNVIFILLDGLRNDKIDKLERFVELKKESYFFRNAIVAAPYTLASMHAIFSGMYPSRNGVDGYNHMLRFKTSSIKTLAQYLKEARYKTVMDANQKIAPEQGFDICQYYSESDDLAERHRKLLKSMCDTSEPQFMYLHYIRIHDEVVHNVGKKFTDFDREYFENQEKNSADYDGYAKAADDYLVAVMDEIKKLGLLEKSIVVVTSDHGISLGERIGEKMYGSFVYDYTIKTMLAVKWPGQQAKELETQVRSIDIMPTILDLLGIEADNRYMKIQGTSLLPIIGHETTEEVEAFSETGGLNGPWPSPDMHNVFCIRHNKKKIIYNKTPNTWEFYDLEKDPKEKKNLIDSGKAGIEEMKKSLKRQIIANKL